MWKYTGTALLIVHASQTSCYRNPTKSMQPDLKLPRLFQKISTSTKKITSSQVPVYEQTGKQNISSYVKETNACFNMFCIQRGVGKSYIEVSDQCIDEGSPQLFLQ